MFISELIFPAEVSDYELHQHLHLQFDRDGRGFIFRRRADVVLMLSIEQPKCPSFELHVEKFLIRHPLPFSADLIITKTKFNRGKAGARYDVRNNDERREWLSEQLKECAKIDFARFNEKTIRIKGNVKRLVATVTGTLTITDTSYFARKLQNGIGRGRAFGCGLIWIPSIMKECETK